MNNFSKYRFLLLSLLISLFSSLYAEPLKLGLSAPLSGGGASWGQDVKNVLIFANEKLADQRYKLMFEDDRCDSRHSLAVAQKFTTIDRVSGAFIVCGQSTMATAAIYKKNSTPLIALLATPSRISELGVFRTSLNDSLAARKLAHYIVKTNARVFVLTEENDYSVSFAKDFALAARELKLEVKAESYLSEQQDFRPQLLRLKNNNTKALFLNTQTEEALANILKQLRELDFRPALYGAYLPGTDHFLKLGGQLAEGLVFVDFPGAEDLLTAEGRALYTEFISRFGPIQGWTYAFPATFEAFRAMHLALSSGKPADDFLRSTGFDGIIGAYTFNTQGDIVGPQQVLRIIRSGKSVILPQK